MSNRFEQIEDNWQYAQGPWEEGATARIVHQQDVDQGPTVDQVGQLAYDSWRAGWNDAAKELAADKASLQSWSTKQSWDADNNCYHSIVDSDGCHLATVRSAELAKYIVKAVSSYANDELVGRDK